MACAAKFRLLPSSANYVLHVSHVHVRSMCQAISSYHVGVGRGWGGVQSSKHIKLVNGYECVHVWLHILLNNVHHAVRPMPKPEARLAALPMWLPTVRKHNCYL